MRKLLLTLATAVALSGCGSSPKAPATPVSRTSIVTVTIEPATAVAAGARWFIGPYSTTIATHASGESVIVASTVWAIGSAPLRGWLPAYKIVTLGGGLDYHLVLTMERDPLYHGEVR